VNIDLQWQGELRFAGRVRSLHTVLDGNGLAGATPVEALGLALAGCMAIDVVHILAKGRVEPKALEASLEADRAASDPRRIVAVRLRFRVTGPAGADKVERAIALSREKYCSVWHSLRPDIDFVTSFEASPA
jgi:putative redox protein